MGNNQSRSRSNNVTTHNLCMTKNIIKKSITIKVEDFNRFCEVLNTYVMTMEHPLYGMIACHES